MNQTSPYHKSVQLQREVMAALDVIDKKPEDAKIIIGSAWLTACDLVEMLDNKDVKVMFDDAGNKSPQVDHKNTVDSIVGGIRIVDGIVEGVQVRMYYCDHCISYFYTGTRTISPMPSITCPYCGTIHKGTEEELIWFMDLPSTSKIEDYNRINKPISGIIYEMLKSDDDAHHGLIYRITKEQAQALLETEQSSHDMSFRPYGRFVICNRAPRGKDRHDPRYMPWTAIFNAVGTADTEDFESLEKAMEWLRE